MRRKFQKRASSAHAISVVIPALNQEAPIAGVVRGISRDWVNKILVVDNGSSDRTAECARNAGARVISEPKRGYGRACRAGVQAVAAGCEIIVFLDGDGSDCPELIPLLLQPILAGTHDFVIGSRLRGKREPGSMNATQIIAGRFAGACFNFYTGCATRTCVLSGRFAATG